jgi:magnesium-transporting ATPase (P-type)
VSRPAVGAAARIDELVNPGAGEGLTETEAAARLARYGPNALPEERPHVLRALIGKLMGPVPWLLEAAIALELAAPAWWSSMRCSASCRRAELETR